MWQFALGFFAGFLLAAAVAIELARFPRRAGKKWG